LILFSVFYLFLFSLIWFLYFSARSRISRTSLVTYMRYGPDGLGPGRGRGRYPPGGFFLITASIVLPSLSTIRELTQHSATNNSSVHKAESLTLMNTLRSIAPALLGLLELIVVAAYSSASAAVTDSSFFFASSVG
jgi:hypothetical protein